MRKSGAPPPPSDSYHSALHANVDCSLCHTETVISCIFSELANTGSQNNEFAKVFCDMWPVSGEDIIAPPDFFIADDGTPFDQRFYS